jgi:hypothetical protein
MARTLAVPADANPSGDIFGSWVPHRWILRQALAPACVLTDALRLPLSISVQALRSGRAPHVAAWRVFDG